MLKYPFKFTTQKTYYSNFIAVKILYNYISDAAYIIAQFIFGEQDN